MERRPDGKDGSKGWEGGEEIGWKGWKQRLGGWRRDRMEG